MSYEVSENALVITIAAIGIKAAAIALGLALLGTAVGWIIAGIVIGLIYLVISILALDNRGSMGRRYAFKRELLWKA